MPTTCDDGAFMTIPPPARAAALALVSLIILAIPVFPAAALPISAAPASSLEQRALSAHYSSPRDFRRCMRETYGPRYFRGVKRAHRFFMAQACGG
jgi:hypothetical protein